MELKLIRKDFGEKATEGELYIRECFTLEDRVREPGVKVPKETAIPYGRYRVVIDFSNRFQRNMLHILNVPMFEGIRIHAGNTDKDTEGCILVGQDKAVLDPDFIGASKIALAILFDKVQAAITYGEEVWIEITK